MQFWKTGGKEKILKFSKRHIIKKHNDIGSLDNDTKSQKT